MSVGVTPNWLIAGYQSVDSNCSLLWVLFIPPLRVGSKGQGQTRGKATENHSTMEWFGLDRS